MDDEQTRASATYFRDTQACPELTQPGGQLPPPNDGITGIVGIVAFFFLFTGEITGFVQSIGLGRRERITKKRPANAVEYIKPGIDIFFSFGTDNQEAFPGDLDIEPSAPPIKMG